MLDVGNFLAHLKWASRLGRTRKSDVSGEYYERLRAAALGRFQWTGEELNLREAICLFRVATNTIRRIDSGWQERTIAALRMVNESLG